MTSDHRDSRVCVSRDRLRGYSGSQAHRTLQAKLSDLASAILPECMNLVMKTCNVLKPVSFSKADIVLQPYTDVMHRPSTSLNRSDSAPILLFYDQIFDTDLLDCMCSNELESLDFKEDSMVHALLTILDFIHITEKHQEAIYKIKNSRGDGDNLTAVLACHLFSQLTPGHKCVIDDRRKSLGNSCPCGCKARIEKDCTAIGSSNTWHGHADMIVNNNIPISLVEETCSDRDSKDEQQPVKKIRKSDDKSFPMCHCEEVKNVKSDSRILSHMQIVDWLIAESITNSFAQVNVSSSLCGWLIPSFGCTAEAVTIFLYDADNDILLQSCHPIELWQSEDVLSLGAIVKVWLFLNFRLFFAKNISLKYHLARSNFHTCAEYSLENYRKVQCNKPISYSNFDYDKLYEPVVGAGKRARLKV